MDCPSPVRRGDLAVDPSAAPRARRSAFVAASVLAALIAVFFGEALLRLQSGVYSSADILQNYGLVRVDAHHKPVNWLLGDPVVQMQPWSAFQRDELLAGRLPLWNPYSGNGTPHLANYQSALLSPFGLPYYALPLAVAVLVSAILKIAALAWFTYLFLRELGLGLAATLIGATAYAFSGHNVLLLAYPHAGAAAALPAGMFFVERACSRAERALASGASARDALRGSVASLAGLCLALGLGLLAGNPEPLAFGVVVVAAYAAFRVVRIARRASPRISNGPRARRAALALGLATVAAGLLALGLAAVQLLPFFEYLPRSHLIHERSHGQMPLGLSLWPLLALPNALGDPVGGPLLGAELPWPNYEAANTVFVGATPLFLAALGLLRARSRAPVAFLALLLALWFAWAYGLLGLLDLTNAAPVLDIAPPHRSQHVFAFCVATLAAFAVDGFRPRSRPGAWRWAGLVALAGAAALLAFALGARALYRSTSAELVHDAARFARHLADQERWVGVPFALGVASCAALLVVRAPRVRAVLCAVVLAATFANTGALLRSYNPVIDRRHFFPRTELLSEVRRLVGDDQLLVLGEDTLPPETNVVYGLRTPACYDGMWIRNFDEAYRGSFGRTTNWRHALWASEAALQLFGVEWVLSRGGWLPIDCGAPRQPWSERGRLESVPLVGAREVAQTFVAREDRLQAVAVYLSAGLHPGGTEVLFRLEDAETSETLASARVAASSLLSAHGETAFPLEPVARPHGRFQTFAFAPVERAARRRFRVCVSSTAARPDAAALVWIAPAPFLEDAALTVDGAPRAGSLAIDWTSRLDRFEPVLDRDGFVLYRYRSALGRYRTVGEARWLPSEEDVLLRLRGVRHDPTRWVYFAGGRGPGHVEGAPDAMGAPEAKGAAVEVRSEEPMRVELRVRRTTPGWLVAALPYYPGWRAIVNGAERPIQRADFAFSAVALEAGESEIELRYQPASVAIGAWISAISAAVLAAALLLARSRRGASPR